MMRKLVTNFLALGFILTGLFTQPNHSNAQVGDAWQLIAEVNALRAAYGLSPYEVNNALMSAAQNQSDYQGSIGSWTHTGPGGSRPHDRAVAAGYGGGARVFVSENVAMGIDLGTSRTVNEMWQDAIHLETMISPLYTHIGAGVGHADGWVYYTIVVGYIAGSAGSDPAPETPTSPGSAESDTTPLPAVMPLEPIRVAAPAADGSIQHVVQLGQFLANIAVAYDMELNDLLAINGLSDQSVIYPGDKLLIKAGSSSPPDAIRIVSPTTEIEPTHNPAATGTAIPTVSTPTPMAVALIDSARPSPTTIAPTEPVDSVNSHSGNLNFLLYAFFGLAITGTAMILLGSALKRR
jgi:uncharacterized protein YkwD/LysM repeat protein